MSKNYRFIVLSSVVCLLFSHCFAAAGHGKRKACEDSNLRAFKKPRAGGALSGAAAGAGAGAGAGSGSRPALRAGRGVQKRGVAKFSYRSRTAKSAKRAFDAAWERIDALTIKTESKEVLNLISELEERAFTCVDYAVSKCLASRFIAKTTALPAYGSKKCVRIEVGFYGKSGRVSVYCVNDDGITDEREFSCVSYADLVNGDAFPIPEIFRRSPGMAAEYVETVCFLAQKSLSLFTPGSEGPPELKSWFDWIGFCFLAPTQAGDVQRGCESPRASI